MDSEALKKRVNAEIDRLSSELKRISLDIYRNPELGYEEHFASRLLADRAEQAGFSVTRETAGLATAFIADRAGRDKGPKVAILAEYDALPSLGHACGHNLIAGASLGASLGLAEIMDQIDGAVMLVGSPAEEKGGGKITLVDQGLFNGTDAALIAHPSGNTHLGHVFLAATQIMMLFYGKSSHAAGSPEKGINALDACIATFNGTNALKKHLRDDSRVNGVILEGGTAANIVPDFVRAVFSVRARDRSYLESVIAKVKVCAEAGAMMAGAKIEMTVLPICAEVKFNEPLNEAFARNAEALGHKVIPRDSIIGGTTDMGNVSQIVPAIHPSVKIGDSSLAPHTREFQEAAGTERALDAMIESAKMLAMTAIDVWADLDLLVRMQKDFSSQQEKTA